MARKDKSNWTIIYTDHQSKFIHLEHLRKSNPDSQIILADIRNNYSAKFAWRNCDLLLREWLRTNKSIIKNNKIAIIEWDVLISQKLPDIDINGLICKNIQNVFLNHRWPYFKEKHKLDKYKQYAKGISPFGVLFMNKLCIEIILDTQFDYLYSKDIFCELRLGTILNSQKIKISSIDLPDVFWYPVLFSSNPGIYHCVKTKQTGLDKPIPVV